MVWYNPPYNAAVTTNIGRAFLQLIDKHFPQNKTRKDKLEKVVNRHYLKLSYSCPPNIKAIITGHNNKILNKKTEEDKKCNCRKREDCPMEGKCLQEAVVYKATISTTSATKTYIGSTENSFKQRWYGHKSDMTHSDNRGKTTLASYFWSCVDNGERPSIKWSIVKKCSKYKCGSRKCDLCLTEKLHILKSREQLLNRRSELMGRCPHMRKWRLQHAAPT